MFFIIVLSVFLTTLHPFGLIFLIYRGGKYLLENVSKENIFYVSTAIAVLAFCYLAKFPLVIIVDMIVVLIFTFMTFFRLLFKTLSYKIAIFAGLLVNIIYAGLRQILFFNSFKSMFQQSLNDQIEVIKQSNIYSEENIQLFETSMDSLVELFSNYQISIWVLITGIGLYVGSLLLSKKIAIKWRHKDFKLPYEFVYGIIVALILSIIPTTRMVGLNICVILFLPLLIQGFAILEFFWSGLYVRSKVQTWLLIIAIIINPFIVLLIIFISVIDLWFNLRKLKTREESNENNSG